MKDKYKVRGKKYKVIDLLDYSVFSKIKCFVDDLRHFLTSVPSYFIYLCHQRHFSATIICAARTIQ